MSTAYFISLPPWKARTRVNCHPFDSCYGHMIVLFLSPGQHLTSSSPVLSKGVELDWFKSICSTWRGKKIIIYTLLVMGQQNRGITSVKEQFIIVQFCARLFLLFIVHDVNQYVLDF